MTGSSAVRDQRHRHRYKRVWLVLAAVSWWACVLAADDDAARFDIWEFAIDDPGLVPMEEVERAVYPHLGVGRRIEDVEDARRALEAVFHAHGYDTVLVNIPEQDVADGVVRLDVLDGHVERLHVTGARYFSLGRIKSQLPALRAGRTPHVPSLQRELAALARANADRRVRPVFRPGRAPGAVEVELEVDDKLPLHGSVSLHDDHTPETSRTRLSAELRYDNLWQREHSVGVNLELSPEAIDEVRILSGTYLFRPDTFDTLIALYGVVSDSDISTIGAAGGNVGVVGKGYVAGLRAIRPLAAAAGRSHNLSLGLDHKDFSDTITVGGGGFETPIAYSRWTAGFDTHRQQGASATDLRLDVAGGWRGLGNDGAEFENKRFKAKPDFLYLSAALNHTLATAIGAWHWRLSVQLASEPLISNEQLSLGGETSVRGYFSSQALVDSGVLTQLDWYSPSFASLFGPAWPDEVQALVFADAAYGEIEDPLPGQRHSSSLASTGLGLQLSGLHGLSSTLLWAFPLLSIDDRSAGEGRIHFRFGYEF